MKNQSSEDLARIDHYSFGSITVDGKSYSSDVILFPDHVQSSWWRLEGHLLQPADLRDVLDAEVPVLIIGTGYHGSMKVPEETVDYLKNRRIETHVRRTPEAVHMYNRMSSKQHVIAALHLTC